MGRLCGVPSIGERGRGKEGGGAARSFYEEFWPMEVRAREGQSEAADWGFVWGLQKSVPLSASRSVSHCPFPVLPQSYIWLWKDKPLRSDVYRIFEVLKKTYSD